MLSAVGSGSFVTRGRVRGYCILLLVAYVVAIGALLATADGIVDTAGRPLGTDFANVYAAGKLAHEGRAALAYDFPAHHDMQRQISGRADIPYYGWHYPPAFLLLAAALAVLPYLGALLVYQAATLVAYLAVVRQIAGRAEAWLPALAFPAVFVNVTHGHNGFITAALLGGALLVLDRRPLLAGVLMGCLAYKPQFGLLVPLVLAATGRWRTIAAAARDRAGDRRADLGGVRRRRVRRLLAVAGDDAAGDPGRRARLPQDPERVRGAAAPGRARRCGQCGADADHARRRRGAGRPVALGGGLRAEGGGLLIGSVLATPYVLDYDLVVLAPAIAFLAVHGLREGFAPYEVTLLVALWVLPLAARSIAEADGRVADAGRADRRPRPDPAAGRRARGGQTPGARRCVPPEPAEARGLTPFATSRPRNRRISARNSSSRSWCTQWPAPSTVTISALLKCRARPSSPGWRPSSRVP